MGFGYVRQDSIICEPLLRRKRGEVCLQLLPRQQAYTDRQ
jgi:hypothetical protein